MTLKILKSAITIVPNIKSKLAVIHLPVMCSEIVMGRCRYFKLVSVFRYRPTGDFFSSRFGICCRYFKISRYRFGISLCVKASRADPKILLPSQSANLDRDRKSVV